MYKNYGDKDIFEWGVLVDDNHSETTYNVIIVRPYDDNPEVYQFGDCQVDITESFIKRDDVMSYLSMTKEIFDPVQFAIGCIDYYGPENFGAISYAYDWMHIEKDAICEILKYKDIDTNNVNIE